MENITIYTRTHYVHEAILELICKSNIKSNKDETLSIFAFEGTWITLQDFLTLKQCQSDRVLVLGRDSSLFFLSKILVSNKIHYSVLDSDLIRLSDVMKNFIQNRNRNVFYPGNKYSSAKILTPIEYKIMDLYISGTSVRHISRGIDIPAKRIYAIKNYAMSKIGVTSDAELINHWDIVRRLPQIESLRPHRQVVYPATRSDIYSYMVL